MGESIGNIAVIILNYNNYQDTVECIDAVLGASLLDIVLVDNLSPDGSGERLREYYAGNSSVTYIQSGENRGYAAGNNVGIKYALESLSDEYICILNNDTLPSPEMFLDLANYLNEHPSCGIVGPVILENEPGQIIQSAGANIDLLRGDVSLWHHAENYVSSEEAVACPYVSGACMMVRAKNMLNLGFLPECYFLFFEETEWCLRTFRRGYGVVCLWSTSLVHKGSASTSKHGSLSSYLMVRNRALFEKRNANPAQLIYYIVRSLVRIYGRHFVRKEDCLWEASALCDGLKNRVRNDFGFIKSDSSI